MMRAVCSVYTHANKKHENQHPCTYPITKQRSTALGHILASPFVSRIADECLEQLIEVGLSRLGKHALIAADSYRKLAARVRPPLLGYPLHLAQLRERARERVKHHRDCGTELRCHRRQLR